MDFLTPPVDVSIAEPQILLCCGFVCFALLFSFVDSIVAGKGNCIWCISCKRLRKLQPFGQKIQTLGCCYIVGDLGKGEVQSQGGGLSVSSKVLIHKHRLGPWH